MQLMNKLPVISPRLAAIQHRNANTHSYKLAHLDHGSSTPGPLLLLLLFYEHTPVDASSGPHSVPHFYAFSHLSLLAGWAAPRGAAILGARLPPPPCHPWPTRLLCVTQQLLSCHGAVTTPNYLGAVQLRHKRLHREASCNHVTAQERDVPESMR